MNIGTSVRHHAVRYPDRLAVDEDGRRSLTYAELDVRTNRLAHHLSEVHGVRRGDRIAYPLHNRLEVVELLVAAAKLGAIAAPMNFRLSETDMRAILGNAGPTVVVTQPELADLTRSAAVGMDVKFLTVGDEYEHAAGSGSDRAPDAAHLHGGGQDALIQYTSGTTGRSKGATFTHDAVLMHAANVCLEYGIGGDSRVLISIPHNSSTNIQLIPALYRGATVVLTDVRSFDGARWSDTVNRLGVTHSQVVPTMLYRVLEHARSRGVKMPTMRMLGYGSAPIPADRVRELVDRFGNIFIQLYGMIEVAAMATMLRPEDHARALRGRPELLTSVGQSSYGIEVRVEDESGGLQGTDGRGEVVFRGPHVMRGYWDAPDLSAEALRGGWMHSGDVGELTDGWLRLVDRTKDIIIRGGQNLASKEIEEALYRHPAVMEAAVVGVADPEWGENVAAAVVLRPGAEATPAEIRQAALSSGLARFKAPSWIDIVPELPRNAIGKIQKGVLREEYVSSAKLAERLGPAL